MSEQEKQPLDAAFRRLADFDSATPKHLFDELITRRTDAVLRDRLDNLESNVPTHLFDSLLNQRVEADLGKKLNEFESEIPDNLFDKLQERRDLRDKLTDYPSPVKEYVFDKVMDEREERRRRRIIYWRWTAVAASLLFVATALWWDSRHSLVVSDKSLVVSRESSGDSQQKTGLSEKQDFDKNSNPISQNSELKTNNSRLTTNDLKNTEGAKNIGLGNLIDSKSSNHQSPITNNNSLKAQQISLITKPQYPAEKGGLGGNVTAQTIDNQSSATNLSYFDHSIPAENLTKFTPLSKTDDFSSSLSDNSKTDLRTVDVVSQLPNKWAFLTKEREKKNPCAGPGDGCPTFGIKKRNNGFGGRTYYIDAFGAPELAFRKLSPNAIEVEKLLQKRDSMERSWYAFSAGVRTTMVFDNGFSMRIGGVFSQNNEIAKRDSVGLVRIITTIDSIPQADGSWQVITKKESITDVIQSTRYNRYRSIDIPIQLGYEIVLNDKWTLGINGGTNFNLAAWRKADIADANGQLVNESSNIGKSNRTFRNVLGISVLGSVSIFRNFENGIQIFVEPAVRHGFKPITRMDYGLKQNYTAVGLNIGVRYRL